MAFFVVVVPEMGSEQHGGEQINFLLTESRRHFRFVSNIKQRKNYLLCPFQQIGTIKLVCTVLLYVVQYIKCALPFS